MKQDKIAIALVHLGAARAFLDSTTRLKELSPHTAILNCKLVGHAENELAKAVGILTKVENGE